MDVQLLSKEKGIVKLQVTGSSAAQMNTLRRIVVEALPSMAIDTLEIVENNSAMFDEMLAHRMGLIVLKTDTSSYFVREKCKCKGEGCARCTLDLTLDVEGPCMVYAEHLESKDPAVVPVHGKTVIVKLLEGQRLKLIAKAMLGTGKGHTKFSPGLLWYQHYPHFGKDAKKIEAVIASSPTDAALLKKHKLKAIGPHMLSQACLNLLEKDGLTTTNDTDFLVSLEPWGQLSAAEIFEGAIEVLDEDLDLVADAIKKAK